jgi:cobalt-zinc-cadmium efflux system outer membrane protein
MKYARSRTTPMIGRILSMAITFASSNAVAQDLTEARVAALARERAPSVLLARSEARLASASREGVGLWPNPQLQWGRQHVLDGQMPSQDILQLNVPFVLSGRLAAESHLAEAEAFGVEAESALAEREAVASVLEAFYRTLGAEQRVAIAERLVASLAEGARVLARRQAAGTIAGVDRVRVDLETELARSRVASERAEARASERVLASMLGLDEVHGLRGDLETRAPAALELILERALASHPALEASERARAAADDASGAADLAWLPDVVLSAGIDHEQERTLSAGYIVGVTLELPFFTNGQGLRARARAQRAIADARADAVLSRIRAQIGAAHAQLVASRRELSRFEDATAEGAELLLRSSLASYLEGQAPIYELLDAQRTVNQIELRRVELAFAAKRAEVLLRIAAGELE